MFSDQKSEPRSTFQQVISSITIRINPREIIIIITVMMINDPFSTRFNDEVSWAFRIFDIDNSGSIAVEEINDSVQVAFVV